MPIPRKLRAFNLKKLSDLTGSPTAAISLLQELKVIPRPHPAPACPSCSKPMQVVVESDPFSHLDWIWECKSETTSRSKCNTTVHPLEGTFFEDAKMSISLVLRMLLGFALDLPGLRKAALRRDQSTCQGCESSRQRVLLMREYRRLYNRAQDVCIIHASHFAAKKKRSGLYTEPCDDQEMLSPEQLAVRYYRDIQLTERSDGDMCTQFLRDVRAVYPGRGQRGITKLIQPR